MDCLSIWKERDRMLVSLGGRVVMRPGRGRKEEDGGVVFGANSKRGSWKVIVNEERGS